MHAEFTSMQRVNIHHFCISLISVILCTSLISVILFQCYYIGGLKISATYILGSLSKPLKSHIPVVKICEGLKKKDSQICDLKYGKLTGHYCK